MVAGLVAVGILPDLARDIGLRAAGGLLRRGKERIEPRFKGFRTAQRADKPLNVVRHEEAVLPRVGLRVVVVHLARIEGAEPAAVETGPHEAGLRIQHVLPILGALHIALIFRRFAQQFGCLGHAPVVVGVFKGLGDAFVLVVSQDQAVLSETLQSEIPGQRRGHHRFESLLIVETLQAPDHGIGNHRNGVIADHAVGFVA